MDLRQDGMVWIGLIWLRIETSVGLLWTRQWTFGFHRMLGSSWVVAQWAASQEGLSSMSEVKWVIGPMDLEITRQALTPFCLTTLKTLSLGKNTKCASFFAVIHI
jgi:hypothetical protein